MVGTKRSTKRMGVWAYNDGFIACIKVFLAERGTHGQLRKTFPYGSCVILPATQFPKVGFRITGVFAIYAQITIKKNYLDSSTVNVYPSLFDVLSLIYCASA
jgi:hypothetical protein